ncbi:SAM-dependent methyltransferase [Actinomycetospora lutea]|uniref:SAM-dependent methyltransferase n=1 Tax=Actinomycetospora lutea TaxID=663604 RepID=UPI0023666E6B|nr:SAM-dependent methyltransferase [Actinomycetospora lutea]MDD7942849.1 SAM-dependent methyltransferase [Actinomycetospora lutea]
MSSRCRTARRSSWRAWWSASAKREELPARAGTEPTCRGSLPAAPTQRWWEARGGQAVTPNAARVGDYLLGGTQHLPADRAFARALEARAPDVRGVCRAVRAFLGRAVVFSLQRGIDQFLVLGEGLVTDGDAHEAARVLNPTVRIAVVDRDPVTTAVNHTCLLLVPGAVAARADLTRPDRVLQLPDVHAVLDLSRPVAVLVGGALAALSDRDDPRGVVTGYAAGLSAGSYLVAWHTSGDNWSHAERAASMWAEHVGPAPLWSRGQMQDCLSGLDLVPPGIIDATAWHPRRATPARGEHPGVYVAVARL